MKKTLHRGAVTPRARGRKGEHGQKRAAKVRARKFKKGDTWSPPLHGPGTGIEAEAKIE